ncbi:MAG: hypothetical protein DRN53_03185 [Thermoprotei archaeon]|nr:MAG: hypothetical protein DRN53_03185 [Thermoprotei archaeon]
MVAMDSKRLGIGPYKWLLVLGMLIVFNNSIWQTLLPFYVDERGFSIQEVGFSSILVISLPWVLSIVAGLIVEKISWRLVLLSSVLLLSISVLYLRWISGVVDLIVILLVSSFAIALFTQSGIEVIATTMPMRRLGLAFASYYALIGLARTIGSLSSGLIVNIWDYDLLYTISSLVFLLIAILILLYFPRNQKPRCNRLDNVVEILRIKSLSILILTIMVHDFSVFITVSYVPLFAKRVLGLSEFEYSLIVTTRSIVYILIQPFCGLLVDRVGEVKVLALHFIGVALSYLGYSYTSGFVDALITYIFLGLATALDLPARRALLSKLAPRYGVAVSSGLLDTMVGLCTLPTPTIGAILWNIEPKITILSGGLMNLLSLAPLLALKRSLKSSRSRNLK